MASQTASAAAARATTQPADLMARTVGGCVRDAGETDCEEREEGAECGSLVHGRREREEATATILSQAQGRSSVGRAAVSKTVGRGFESLRPCCTRRAKNRL